MDKWADCRTPLCRIWCRPGEPWIFDGIRLECEILDIDTTREEIYPLSITSCGKCSATNECGPRALCFLHTCPGIDEAIIGTTVCSETRVGISEVASFELEDLDIAETTTPRGNHDTTTVRCGGTSDSVIRILLYIPAKIGPRLCSLVDEIELLH